MAAQVMLKKISEFTTRQMGYLVVPEKSRYLDDYAEVPVELRETGTYVMRLTTIIEVVDGLDFQLVPEHRRDAYVYAALSVALNSQISESHL
ncbi:hypothetical protein Aduo_002578 [Ancylostoma duodenale]